jgi:hypothetical protein
VLHTWLAAGDWSASHAFFQTHTQALTNTETHNQLQTTLTADPTNNHLATHLALINLATHGHTDLGYHYLTTPNPEQRQQILLEPLHTATPDTLPELAKTLANLSRGAATNNEEHVTTAILTTLANTLSPHTPTTHPHQQQHLTPESRSFKDRQTNGKTRIAHHQVITEVGVSLEE